MKRDARHRAAIDEVLAHLNSYPDSPYVLKGGTALMECCGLDRESEDIGLDAPRRRTPHGLFFRRLDALCEKRGYKYRVGKDSAIVQRAFLDYGAENRPLKIELSYRMPEISPDWVTEISGIKVYRISRLAEMKASAYSQRDKIRDLYDVSFICTHLLDGLDQAAVRALTNALIFKDLEQFDYIVRTQSDPLIDPGRLEGMFLESFGRLGLLASEGPDGAEGEGKAVGQGVPSLDDTAGAALSLASPGPAPHLRKPRTA